MGKNQAQINYRKKAVKTLYLDMNLKTDADILKWLDAIAMKTATAIKNACRKQMSHAVYKANSKCPSCGKNYNHPTDAENAHGYCPYCGQAVIYCEYNNYYPLEWEASTPVQKDTEESTPVQQDAEACTPVDTEESTPVQTDAEACTPVDTAPEYWHYGKNDWDTVTYEPTPEELKKARQIEKEEGRNKRNQYSAEVMENHFRRGVFSGIHYTPVDTIPEASTPVQTDAETSALWEDTTEAPNYEIFYITKKGGAERYRNLKVYGRNAREAVKIFREIHKSTFEKTEGHAFQPKAKRMT